MSVATIGAAVVGGVMANKAANKQAAATRDAAAMGAAAADPFANQRGYYQNILAGIYGAGNASPAAAPASTPEYGGVKPAPSVGGTSLTSDILAQDPRAEQSGGQWWAKTGYDPLARFRPTSGGTAGNTTSQPAFGNIMDFITSSPDYQFRFAEGQRALERSNAAAGMLNSGNLLLDLVGYGQGKAAEAYNAEINRIMTMAGATIGSPGTAGQLISSGGSSAASTVAQGQNVMTSQLGYGLAGAINAFNQPTTANSMISGQTGYTGGASGVLSGNEFASW